VEDLKLYAQFQDLGLSYPKLRLQRKESSPWYIRGLLEFSKEYSGKLISDLYQVQILIPETYSDELPKIHETGNRIPKDFHHYKDESLCLGAPLEIKRKFRKQPTLLGYVDNCVIPYLYSFSYKTRFGKMPFGELSHGGLGILEYYQDLFDLKDVRRILKFIQILAVDNYRGHARCPCGNGKRLRDCHGKILLEIKDLQTAAEFQAEYNLIVKNLIDIAFQKPYRPYI
jgi:hypothetical protein